MMNVRTGWIHPSFVSIKKCPNQQFHSSLVGEGRSEPGLATQHNTSRYNRGHGSASAGSRPPRPPVCPAQAEHILLCPLLLVYCPCIVHQWAVLAALAAADPARAHCPGLWRSDGSRTIVTVTVPVTVSLTSHSPGGDRGTTWSESCGSTRRPG